MKKKNRSSGAVTSSKRDASRTLTGDTVSNGRIMRRDVFKKLRNGTIAAGVLGLGGLGLYRSYSRHVELLDLTAIGNGIPTIVQVHDPHCPTCQELQKRTLRAAKDFEATELQVRVANIRTLEGRAIADRYGVPHVTLLLFDGQGEMRRIVRGLQEVNHLRDQFDAHVTRFPKKSSSPDEK